MVNNEWCRWKAGKLLLNLKVQTGASNNKFAEIIEDRIKLRIKAVAVNGKANEAIIKFLSQEFCTPISSIQILRGNSSTKKLVVIHLPACLPKLPGLTQNNEM